jgi:DNA adenine methylase
VITHNQILSRALQRALDSMDAPLIHDSEILARIVAVSRDIQSRALARLVLACCLAKAFNATLDIRKPYTAIGTSDSYSGRTYDESYVAPFVMMYNLPCNSTTAFLTPALRNRNVVLLPDLNLVGRPAGLYQQALQLLTDVEQGVDAFDVLSETIRQLLILRDENRGRIESLIARLKVSVQYPLQNGMGTVPNSGRTFAKRRTDAPL